MMRLPIVDDLQWLAMTVLQEAEGESYQGKLAVAYTICTRAKQRKQSIPDVVLQKLQFSAWNADSPTRMRLDTIDPQGIIWTDCYRAACSALFVIEPDPTGGAAHYLNIEETKKANKGLLPAWVAKLEVSAVIGRHTFLVDPPGKSASGGATG